MMGSAGWLQYRIPASRYDAMDRVELKTMADVGPNQTVRYCYDGKTYDDANGTCMGGEVPGKKMRLTAVGNRYANGTKVNVTNYEQFDALGRITRSSQLTQGGSAMPYVFNYSYYRDGSLASMEYPSQKRVASCYDRAGRAKWVSGQITPGDCASGVTPTTRAGNRAMLEMAGSSSASLRRVPTRKNRKCWFGSWDRRRWRPPFTRSSVCAAALADRYSPQRNRRA